LFATWLPFQTLFALLFAVRLLPVLPTTAVLFSVVLIINGRFILRFAAFIRQRALATKPAIAATNCIKALSNKPWQTIAPKAMTGV
jgi:hypothetical protein